MQFKAFESGIEISGDSVAATLDGFKKYPAVAMNYLMKFGFIKNKSDEINRSAWYAHENWLRVFEGIAIDVGPNSLYSIGKTIPANAVFPPQVNDIYSAIGSLDIAYHMNHRKNGVVMFNPETGAMIEGIGHYRATPTPSERKIVCVAENPYPCELDRGIYAALAARFEAQARTVHDDEAPCRKKGADSCTYTICW